MPKGSSGRGAVAMTLDEYLGKRGLSSPISNYLTDKLRIPHGMTERQNKAFLRDAEKARIEYSSKREAAIREYSGKVSSGEIIEKTAMQKRIEVARGNPDNPSVQAARNRLRRMGIKW